MKRRARLREGGRVWTWLGIDWVWRAQWPLFIWLGILSCIFAWSEAAYWISIGVNTAIAWLLSWRPVALHDLE